MTDQKRIYTKTKSIIAAMTPDRLEGLYMWLQSEHRPDDARLVVRAQRGSQNARRDLARLIGRGEIRVQWAQEEG